MAAFRPNRTLSALLKVKVKMGGAVTEEVSPSLRLRAGDEQVGVEEPERLKVNFVSCVTAEDGDRSRGDDGSTSGALKISGSGGSDCTQRS
mmetsp:Transcript_59685/g.73092  ORF Transcript_59685/g.73092 Transcript_59685/m.73092 type:complete len:91 (+) Transcript_59685:316-588(+)